MTREQLHYDLLIIGAGPAGLAAACRAAQRNPSLRICLLEKGAEIGAHNVSGAIFKTTALNELFPDWRELGAPLHTQVTESLWRLLPNEIATKTIPECLAPTKNLGNFVISISQLCRWLGEQATKLGVEIYTGFAAKEILFSQDGSVGGVITGDMGLDKERQPKSTFCQGVEIHSKYTFFCEGARGHLGQQLIKHFALAANADPQHYALGIKEVWRVPAQQHKAGQVLHSIGWPLSESHSQGGGFIYHWENISPDKSTSDCLISVGLIIHLSYSNPNLNPFAEFQRYKHHPLVAQQLAGGERLEYAARAIAKGGLQSQPKMTFAGGLILGDNAGTLNFTEIKGNHTAMKTGMLAADVAVEALAKSRGNDELVEFELAYRNSWAFKDLWQQRNIAPALDRWGYLLGGSYALIDKLFKGKLPWTLQSQLADHHQLQRATDAAKINYPAPDGKLSFDLPSSVYLTNSFHTENQPLHLQILEPSLIATHNIPLYDEPAQRYCPAGVYELTTNSEPSKVLQINASNCIHCKTCDIKDPLQNIQWVTPEGGSGPKYFLS